MPARAIACKRYTAAIDTQLFCIFMTEIRSRRGIVMRRRKGVLRREAVLYGNNPTSADVSQLPQLIVVGDSPPLTKQPP
ncbi:hypothetical protein SEH50133_10152 [Salmonella enterica subsp. houtenae serovar 50:g,z51:- str. 01-0133]|nr:hypothetical protein SEHO0A_04095 [Salmonella enterica subsp. houtenae str. ATCC BAA-1581]ENZ84652.1 hypothetical protein D088_530033 [Salmonella enterica subsp. houtenae serovar 16:z4,z32:-- str. RKS3027]ESE89505.1 hypothetical protein SEH50133_10152 [Salmonella enterica subsp. houtenae serovar 50:g,z51:- str. 01-0133]